MKIIKNHRRLSLFLFSCFAISLNNANGAENRSIEVGSKRFTESYILGEIFTKVFRSSGQSSNHHAGLGNTSIVSAALDTGKIDLYPEYTGTLASEILKINPASSISQIKSALAPMHLAVGFPLGFSNSYQLAIRSVDSKAQNITKLSDLKRHPEYRFGLSHEFVGRTDGWAKLSEQYALLQKPTGLDHGLAYSALAKHEVDVIDVYTTDARLKSEPVLVLEDDLHFFPSYDALILYREDFPKRFPKAWQALSTLEGKIDQETMIAMNNAVEISGFSYSQVANLFIESQKTNIKFEKLVKQRGTSIQPLGLFGKLFDRSIIRLALEHVYLILFAIALACIFSFPVGVFASRHERTGRALMYFIGLGQTIPSLAMLAVLIPVFGTSTSAPAIFTIAIFAMLPIVHNTYVGIKGISAGTRLAGQSLGLTPAQVLWNVELPLASPVIASGVQTATVIAIGTATLAAFIGAGGFGERIVLGLATNDYEMMLAGAIPASCLAIVAQICLGASCAFLKRKMEGRCNQDKAVRIV